MKRFLPILLLLLITILAFGLLIPWLGFYWDDWAKILVARLFGLGGYPAYYAEDRPLSSWTHMLFTPVLGTGPLGWHLFTLLLRWLSAWGMLWSLDGLWPGARRRNLAAALLFLIYPVFLQQPAAVTFHQQWLQYALFFFSLGAMIRAWRGGRHARAWMVTSLLAMVLQLSVTEYFVPLELVRPLALWFLAGQGGKENRTRRRGRNTFREREESPASHFAPSRPGEIFLTFLRAWAPYGAVLALYVAWRLFFIRLPGEDPYRANTLFDFIAHPLQTLASTALVTLTDEIHILITTWADLLYVDLADVAPFTLFSCAVGLLSAAVTVALLLRWPGGVDAPPPAGDGAVPTGVDPAPATPEATWIRQALALGALAVLLGPVPAWITGRQVVFDFHSDRYAMPAMFGAALLLAAGIEWLAGRRLQRAVLLGVLVGLAVGANLRVANQYRWWWIEQRRLYWQMAWRAPGLAAPTVLLMEDEPVPNQGLFSTSAAFNLLYPQAGPGDPLDFWVYTLRPRFEQGMPADASYGFQTTFRTLTFRGNLGDALLLYDDPRYASCLWVLEPADTVHPYLPGLVAEAAQYSDLTRILPQATGSPPEALFGPEPAHGWCYYYEKAALARQLGDWQEAARLGDAAQALGYAPGAADSPSPFEWLPVIEAYRKVGREEEAQALARAAYARDANYGTMLCALWPEEEVVREAMGCGENLTP